MTRCDSDRDWPLLADRGLGLRLCGGLPRLKFSVEREADFRDQRLLALILSY